MKTTLFFIVFLAILLAGEFFSVFLMGRFGIISKSAVLHPEYYVFGVVTFVSWVIGTKRFCLS